VNEARELAEEGFTLPGCDIVFRAKIVCFICDAPARAFVKQVKPHMGYYACERCLVRGEHVDGKVTFCDTDAEKRTDEVFRTLAYEGHQFGASPLLELDIGLVSGFVLDSMHLVYIGVTRKLINCWKTGKGAKNPKAIKLCSRQLEVISGKLCRLRDFIPREFQRKPRSLFHVDRWKASELRQFLLYTGIVVLKSEIDEELYDNFVCLSVAIFLLSAENLSQHYCDYAEQMLVYFVEKCEQLYGAKFMVYNVHGLIHIADDVRKFGSLEHNSSFPFENFLGKMKKCVRKPQHVLQQVHNRICDGYFSPCVHKPNSETPQVKHEHNSGPVLTGVVHFRQYKEVETTNFMLSIYSGNNCVSFLNNKIGIVKNICSDGKDVFLIMQRFRKMESMFHTPLNSADIGIFKLSSLRQQFDLCNITDINCKYVLMPLESGQNLWIGTPLLHTV
jgi:hypothetical protein